MRKIVSFVVALTLLAGLCVPVSAAGTVFSDVAAGKWYTTHIERAAGLGLVSGVGGGKYAPDKQVTYAEFATMLVAINWSAEVSATATHPSDPWWMRYCIVADDHNLFPSTPLYDEYEWYTWANKPVSRSDMAMMTYNYMLASGGVDIQDSAVTATVKNINDISGEDALHTKAIAYCYSDGLLNGTGGGKFSPQSNMTRAQAATVLCNVYDTVATDPDASRDAQVTVSAAGKYPTAIVSVKVATSDTIEFAFCIEPEEDYPGVIMPDDNYASIYGGGTVEFEPITFTQDAAPGEYKFTIYQLEGMEDYRYDDRAWTLTVNLASNGGIARPEGAIGGHYDTSKYTALADVNSDGWITADEVQAVLNRLRVEYPDGSTWTETTTYPGLYTYSGGAISGGLGPGSACAGFARLVSDQIFGNLPYYEVSIEQTRIGDYMSNGPANHANIVLNDYGKCISPIDGKPYATSYGTVNGNSNGHVAWETVARYSDWPTGAAKTFIYSRYPAEDGSWTALEMSVESVSYSRNSEAMPETSSEHAHFVNTCLEGMQWDRSTVAKANEIMAGMSLEEKVGQLILFHYPGNGSGTVAQAANIINNYHVGGFLVFANMFNGSNPTAVSKKVADTQAASDIPLLFTVDEEGGTVNRISLYTAFRSEKFKSPSALKAAGGLSAVIADCVEKSALLKSLGMNVNHAPVADLATESGSFMYNRAWRGDGVETAKYVEAVVRATEGAGVGTTMKHFPGYGGTSGDTHAGFNVNSLPLENFLYDDTLPFQAGMTAGGHSVMVTHNTIEAFDSVNPSSLAPAVYDFLRSEMHFDGVAMTDDLAMGAITAHVGANQASLRALQAGEAGQSPCKDFVRPRFFVKKYTVHIVLTVQSVPTTLYPQIMSFHS